MPGQNCFHLIGISNVYFFIVRKLLNIQNENVIRQHYKKHHPALFVERFLKHLNNLFFSLCNAKDWHTSVIHATDKIKVKQ